jgi:hypothetical protein
VARKILFIIAAILLPGGLIALTIMSLAKMLQQTELGRGLMASARRRVPAWATSFTTFGDQQRQAA